METRAWSARVPFWKMSGSGNDFVVIDNRDGILPPATVPDFVRRVCRRRVAVGADGVVLIDDVPEATASAADFRWRYVNADGSDGEMCGNGAMCAARFAFLNGIAPACSTFLTPSGLVRADVDPDPSGCVVRIAIADPDPIRSPFSFVVAGHQLTLHALGVGVPHAVHFSPDVDEFGATDAFVALGREVRHHPAFAPAGTNLNVIAVVDESTLRMRTYERGVEDETLACGTGAVASAVVATALGAVAPPVTVITRGGNPLVVDFAWDGRRASEVTLGGEGRVVATGEIWPEALT